MSRAVHEIHDIVFCNEVDLVPKEYLTTRRSGVLRGRPSFELIAIANPLPPVPAIKVRANGDRTPPGTGGTCVMGQRRGVGGTQ